MSTMKKIFGVLSAAALVAITGCGTGRTDAQYDMLYRAAKSAQDQSQSARKLAVAQQFQKDWARCVDTSYQTIQRQTANKNAARASETATRRIFPGG